MSVLNTPERLRKYNFKAASSCTRISIEFAVGVLEELDNGNPASDGLKIKITELK